ncbi:disks large homolog 5 [Drosophila willistoni]|uniref:disks large homolog 5 n=1 Tax=Drosophila willistoni TaxID=7260 RepID=UPI001F076FF1|nr:disks large homolog 5 [Drosophila willistoni]XP_046866507.1 disks large homolog 5 [Drosophila willistoni]
MAKMASGDLSLTSTSSQEEESSEYVGYDSTLRPPSNSSGSTTAANMANNNGPNKVSNTSVGVGVGVPVPGQGKKYELLQSQYESAVLELTTLRHQHSDTERRCDELATQLNLYQEVIVADRNKYTDIAAESVRLKQKLRLMESQQQQNGNTNAQSTAPTGGSGNAMYYYNKSSPCDGSCSEKLAEVKKERNMVAVEREKYKKSYIEMEKERNFYRDRGEENQTLKLLLSKETKNVVNLNEELNQLLSEKDNVLQEHQKMSDDLAIANKEIERFKKDDLMFKTEIKALQLANAELKKRDLLKSRESSWSKEFTTSSSKDDTSKELEKMRKSLEKALSEVERAVQDADEAKRVRDWAISQREKIVQERDSVKTLCDKMRHERDKAISDSLMAIRDSEKIKKLKDEAQKKIDLLKDQLESQQQLDNALRRSFLMSSYEGEDLLEIELANYHDGDLGIILDDSNKRGLPLVCGVTNSSPAFGKLKINDVICKINNMDCQALSKRMVLDEIRACAPRILLLVSRTRHSKHHSYSVQLKSDNHGLQLDMGVFIAKIEQNSKAFYEPELDVGDRILSINNKSMDSVQSIDEVMQLINDTRSDTLNIFALKYVQDHVQLGEGGHPCRTTTSSAQTDSIDSMQHVSGSGSGANGGGGGSASKHPSKIADFLRKLSRLSKPGTADDNFEQEHDDAIAALDSVLSENSSEKSKENLFKRNKRGKKEKEAASKSMGTWPRTNISHDNPTGTIVRGGEKKRALMSLFTPGPINVDNNDDTEPSMAAPKGLGMAVGDKPQQLQQEQLPPPLPPPLSKPLAHIRNANGSAIKTNPNRNSNPVTSLFAQPPSNSIGNNSGNSLVGQHSHPRHSLYSSPDDLPQKPLLLQRPAPFVARAKIPSQDRYGSRPHNSHRLSLNITPSGDFYQPKTSGQQAQQQVVPGAGPGMLMGTGSIGSTGPAAGEFPVRKQQMYDVFHPPPLPKTNPNAVFVPLNPLRARGNQPADVISLKSQNSIESILSTKSPPPPISEYNAYPKRHVPMPQAPQQAQAGVKHVPKYPSDSESIGSGMLGMGGTGAGIYAPPHPHTQAPGNRHTQLFPSFVPNVHGLRGLHGNMRRSSPLTLPSPPPPQTLTQAPIEGAIGIPTDLENYHPPHPQPYLDFTAQNSMTNHGHYPYGMNTPGGGVIYEGGTFPRKKDNQRLRIPSNPSVASKSGSMVKNSSGSIDHHYAALTNANSVSASSSERAPMSLMSSSFGANILSSGHPNGGGGSGRGSPMPQVHVEVLSHGGSGSSKRNSNVPADFLCPGDLRRVTIDKRDKSLGITIQCNNNGGGIFVSTVADKSTAMRAGLQVGDQLLEVCGINMRAATQEIAANVLRQCGDSFTMLVQYNPEKFPSPAEYESTSGHQMEPESPVNHSGSPTPRNSPRPPARNMLIPMSIPMSGIQPLMLAPTATTSSSSTSGSRAPLSHQSIKDQSFTDSLENQSDISSSQDMPSSAATTTTTTASGTSTVYDEDPKPALAPPPSSTVAAETLRYVTLHMDKSKNLGIKLFGGNKVGIYVHDVAAGSPSDHAGIRIGDQILEYNGVDLSGVTAEQAANEISKLTDTVTMLVQNKLHTLKQIKDEPGDSFYIRVGFDRIGELSEADLRFVKDEVLYVDSTVFDGTFGLWRAWKLDAIGHRTVCGIIPSQLKVEEELKSGEVVDCDTGTARRGSTSARRSFFRRKKNQRSSSRDSTEIASFSNTQLSFFPDLGLLNDDGGILSYQRVELLDSPIRRPVLIIGPLSECLMDRLIIDFSNLFKRCEVTAMDCSQEAMEEGLKENIFVDYRRRGNKFECTTVEAISHACKNDRRHCILDVSISAVERLQRLQIYPIVLLLRFKSAKQIRDIRDFGSDKISAKAAKEMYERAQKLGSDYKQYISAVIPGVSIKHMCTQIKDAVDKEQDKLLWVPVSNC